MNRRGWKTKQEEEIQLEEGKRINEKIQGKKDKLHKIQTKRDQTTVMVVCQLSRDVIGYN